MSEWIFFKDPNTCCLKKTHFIFKDKLRLKAKRWKKTFYANSNQKSTRVATFISDKIDLISKTVKRDKEGKKSITVKRLTNQEDITIKICIYANIRAHKYIKQI